MVITGVVSSIIYHNNDNNFYILSIETDDREVTLKGTFNQIDLELCYEFHVVAKNHPVYGEQYEVEAYKLVMPTNSEKMEK